MNPARDRRSSVGRGPAICTDPSPIPSWTRPGAGLGQVGPACRRPAAWGSEEGRDPGRPGSSLRRSWRPSRSGTHRGARRTITGARAANTRTLRGDRFHVTGAGPGGELRTAVDEPESAAVDRAVAEVRRVRSMKATIAWIERASGRPRCPARPPGLRVMWRSAPRGDRLRHQSTASGGRGQGPGVPSPAPSPRDAVGGGHLMAERIAAAAPATSDAL